MGLVHTHSCTRPYQGGERDHHADTADRRLQPTAHSILDETFTAENGLSADVAIIVPEGASSERPLGVLLFFSADLENWAYVEEFLQERLIDELSVSPDRVLTTGLSGGSDFAASFHFHTELRYDGGGGVLCGGDVPRLKGGVCEPTEDPEVAPAPTARARYAPQGPGPRRSEPIMGAPLSAQATSPRSRGRSGKLPWSAS